MILCRCKIRVQTSHCLVVGVRNEGSESITLVSLWMIDKYGMVLRYDDLNLVIPQVMGSDPSYPIVIADSLYRVKFMSSKGSHDAGCAGTLHAYSH